MNGSSIDKANRLTINELINSLHPYLALVRLLPAVLRSGRVQQRRHATHGRPAVHAAGEDLELVPADKQGAHRHPHVAAPQHLGESLQQPDQR